MVHIILFDLIILTTCYGKVAPLILAGLANLIAIVEWYARKHEYTKELYNAKKEERLKTIAQMRKGVPLNYD